MHEFLKNMAEIISDNRPKTKAVKFSNRNGRNEWFTDEVFCGAVGKGRTDMIEDDFTNLYWKQFLMIEKEFRKSIQYVAIAPENYNTYSDFFAKILLQIGSEVDVAAKLVCKEINPNSTAHKIDQYNGEILAVYPEFENVTVKCEGLSVVPWQNWSADSPAWWKIYNGVKHNRGKIESYAGEIDSNGQLIYKENYKFATLKTVVSALAGLYLLELYMYKYVTGANSHIETPLPGSRLFRAKDQGWESKSFYDDFALYVDESGCLFQVTSQVLYGDI